MTPPESDRRSFLTAGAALSLGAVLPGPASAASDPTVLAQSAGRPTPAAAAAAGRLTFHGSDVYHGLTIGTMRVDVSMLEGNAYRLLKTFDTAKDGRSDGAWFEGPTFKPGRYELLMHVGDYYASLGAKLPSPPFLTQVPLRFNVADVAQHYHIGVWFGPWSYTYYRGS